MQIIKISTPRLYLGIMLQYRHGVEIQMLQLGWIAQDFGTFQ